MPKAVHDDLESELAVAIPAGDQLKSIEVLVNKGIDLMNQIASAEEFLKAAKADLHTLNSRDLPDAMAAAGTSKFTTTAGADVKIKDYMNGSLPKEPDKRKKAFDWIKTAEADDLIKDYISIEFEKGEANIAGEIKAKLEEMGLEYKSERTIHPQTLAAFARERLKSGLPVPLETLGLVSGRVAKIDLPKSPAVGQEPQKVAPAPIAQAAPQKPLKPQRSPAHPAPKAAKKAAPAKAAKKKGGRR